MSSSKVLGFELQAKLYCLSYEHGYERRRKTKRPLSSSAALIATMKCPELILCGTD